MINIFHNLKNKISRKANKIKQKRKKINLIQEENISLFSKFKNFFSQKSRLGLGFLSLLLILFLVYSLFKTVISYINFNPQGYTNSSIETKNDWNGNNKLTILLIGTDKVSEEHIFVDHLSILSFDPKENKLSIFVLNPDIKVTQRTLGYTLNYRTILNNRQIEGDRLEVLIKSVENLVALKIDRYLIADKNTFPNISSLFNPLQINIKKDIYDVDTVTLGAKVKVGWGVGNQQILPIDYLAFAASDNNGRDDQLYRQQELISSLSLNLLGLRSAFNAPEILKEFEKNIYTDLGKSELFHLLLSFSNLKKGDITKGYLRSYAYSPIIDIGFYETVSPDINQIDKDLSNIFFDLKVFKEQARIEVLNASSIKGLATNRARWIKNIGGRVIQVGNSFDNEIVTTIYCKDTEKYSMTIEELKRILGYDVKIEEKAYPNRHIGDIVIVLGKDNN